MAKPAWLNDNQFRDYPFLTRVEPLAQTTDFSSESIGESLLRLPHSAIVDFCAIMEIDAEYDELDGHFIYLHSVSRFSDLFTFKFRTNAPEAANHEVLVYRELTSPEFLISRDDASTIVAESANQFACPQQPKWSATVVTGSMREMDLLLSDGETLIAVEGLWQIEPARVQSLKKSYLRAVNLANAARLHATPQEGCSLSSSDSDNPTAIPAAYCMNGNLKFKEGYNCTIRQDVNNNAIIIGAGVGVGEGLPCEEVPLYEGEEPPSGSRYLSGGPGCSEIIKSINGVSGDDVSIIAGRGFRVQPATDSPHKLVIDRALDDFALCDAEATVSSMSTSDSAAEMVCGGFTVMTQFEVKLLSGFLFDNPDTTDGLNDDQTLLCTYDATMSLSGHMTWTSPPLIARFWDEDARTFCGIRWRAKLVCTEVGLLCSIVGYPLADNAPCRTCSNGIPAPLTLPILHVVPLTCRNNSKDCACFETELVKTIRVKQL